MIHGAMTCPATLSTQLQNIHLICFAAHSGPFCIPQPQTYWLIRYGYTAAAAGANEEEGCICGMGCLHDCGLLIFPGSTVGRSPGE